MPIPLDLIDENGQLIPIELIDQMAALRLKSRGIRDGSGGARKLKMGSVTRRLMWLQEDPEKFWHAMYFLLGAAKTYTDGSGKVRLSRTPPFSDAAEPQVMATEIDTLGFKFVEDDGTVRPIPEYDATDLDVTMETAPFLAFADASIDFTTEMERYVERLPDEPSAQYLNMPGAGMNLKFRKSGGGAPDGITVNYNVGFVFVKSKIRRRWYRVPRDVLDPPDTSPLFKRITGDPDVTDPADPAYWPYLGSCNSTKVFGYRPGTLILVGFSADPVYDMVSSDYCYNITYTWDWVPHGANSLYYFAGSGGGTSSWYLASRGAWSATPADADVQFPLREHADLFIVGDL